uniref:Uncharacterized protein n=1 Tax=Kalanchoe fedtschenkoi TaxID=63787 RepID=A0A7N0ZSP5_KALFE
MELQLLLKRYWRRRQYEKLDGSSRRKRSRVLVGFGRLRKLKRMKKVRVVRLWRRFKDGYVDMMLRLAESVGEFNYSTNGFAVPRRARDVKSEYTKEQFEKRIVFEIYKSLAASRHLGSAYA